MTKRISNLSAEQKARFPEFVEKWTRIGLSTDPANRPEAEDGVRIAYRSAKLEPPQNIVWCGSPFEMALARPALARPKVQNLVQNTVWKSSWNSVQDSVHCAVSRLVQNSVQNPVVSSVWNTAGIDVWLSIRAWARLDDCVYGQHHASSYAYYDYFRVVCGLSEQTVKMLGLMQVAENANWWMPHEDICWICERPNRLIFDRGRLHCEDGPALTYPDGFSIYSIHGVHVDEQVVMSPQSQDVDKIRTERNTEVKRIRIERFGWAEYLRDIGATIVDVRDNDVEATKEALMKTPDGQIVLVCACPSTSRVYCLEVPPTITTCEAAQDWLSGGLSARVINGA